MTREEELLIEQVTSAHRTRTVDGDIQGHPAFYDLNAEGRAAAFEETARLREMEAALDGDGYSNSVHAILKRIVK